MYLKSLDDNCMVQVLREPTQKDAILDVLLVNREDLVSKVEMSGHPGHSDRGVIALLSGRKVPAKPQLWT